MAITVLILLLSIISLASGSVFYKMGSINSVDSKSSPALLCSMYFFIAALGYAVAVAASGSSFIPTLPTLITAIIAGLSFSAAYLYILAHSCGPYTVSAIFINFSNFLPIIYCLIFPRELFGLVTFIGIILMIISVIALTSRGKSDGEKKITRRWVVFISLTVLTNSVISYMIRLQEYFATPDKNETSIFFLITFGVASLFNLIIFFACRGHKIKQRAHRLIPAALGLAATIGGNVLTQSLLYQRGVDAAIQAPIVNGGAIILTAVFGIVFFKDKLTLKSWMALFVGIFAIVLLSL